MNLTPFCVGYESNRPQNKSEALERVLPYDPKCNCESLGLLIPLCAPLLAIRLMRQVEAQLAARWGHRASAGRS